MSRNFLLRGFYAVIGTCALGIGLVGLALPVMPGTIFLIIALACFAKSNKRLEQWLLEHPRLNPLIKKWHESRKITWNIKIFGITAVGLSTLAILLMLPDALILKVMIGIVGASACAYLLRLPVHVPSEASNKNAKAPE
ncbi:MAG: YbaN family protein [Fimbriimonadales bacterium]|nr:YbaN family protein [Fimbriimonadales bacterium]